MSRTAVAAIAAAAFTLGCCAVAENTQTAEYTSSGTEDGYLSFGTPPGSPSEVYIVLGPPGVSESYGFVRFTVFDRFDALDRPLDPPIFTELALKLVLNSISSAIATTVSVYFAPVATLENAYDVVDGDAGFQYLVEANLVGTATVAALTAAGTEVEIDLDLTRISPYYLKSNWDGKLAFGLASDQDVYFAAEENATYTAPTLEATWVSFLTGKSGPEWNAWSRVDRCDQCGRIDVREKFVRDGYSPGLWVCPKCYDPPDRPYKPIPPDIPPIND